MKNYFTLSGKVALFITILSLFSYNTHAQWWRLEAASTHVFDKNLGKKVLSDSIKYIYNTTAKPIDLNIIDTIGYDTAVSYDNKNGTIVKYREHVRTYYPNGNLHTDTRYTDQNPTNIWQRTSVDSFYYNSNGHISKFVDNNFGNTNGPYVVEPYREWIFQTDANGNIILEDTYQWTGTGTNMEPSFKNVYRYNANGDRTLDSMLTYHNNSWRPLMELNTIYNAQGRKIEEVDSTLFPYSEFNARKYYYYNAQGLPAGDSIQSYIQGKPLIEQRTNEYFYNTQGQLIADTLRRFAAGSGTSQLIYISGKTYKYNAQGLLTERTQYVVNYPSGITNDISYYFYYQLTPNSIGGIRAIDTNLYIHPVPANNVLNITWENPRVVAVHGRIINLYGQTVYQWQGQAQHFGYTDKIDVSNLAAGQYFVEMHTAIGLVTKRFVIIR